MHDNGGLGSRSVPDISGNEGVCLYNGDARYTGRDTDLIAVGSRVTVIPTAGSRSLIPRRRSGLWSRTLLTLSSAALNWGGIGRRWCGGRSPSTTAVWSSPPRAVLNSPEYFRLAEKESLNAGALHTRCQWKKMLFSTLMCGVECIDDVGFDPPFRADVETVLAGPFPDFFQLLSGSIRSQFFGRSRRLCAGLAGRGDLLCDLDIWGECRFDLVGIGGPKINPIVGALV